MSNALAGMIMGAFVLSLITVVVVVVLWRGMEVARTQMTSNKEADFKKLAEASVASQQEIVAEQKKTRMTLDEIRDRLAAVEKLLREVG
jgi:hypothetical protein